MEIDFWSVLLLFGFVQGLFFSGILVFQKKGNRQANLFLAAIIALIAFETFTFLIINTNLYLKVPHLIGTGVPFLFLIGPLYFFYIKTLLENEYRFQTKHLIHLLPFVGALIYRTPYFLISAEKKIAETTYIKSAASVEIPLEVLLFFGVHTLLITGYLLAGINLLHKQYKASKEPIINGKRLKLNWLKVFTATFALYWLLTFLGTVVLALFEAYVQEVDYVVVLSMSLIIHVIGYFSIKKSALFSDNIGRSTILKYETSPIDKNEAKLLEKKLQELMEEEKLYLDNNLKLSKLAERLDTSPNYLSQVINQHMEYNFYDFVNEYRVREAKEKLRNPSYKQFTILAIAYEVGFNNKNSFNKAFKKFTGTTPSAFIKN